MICRRGQEGRAETGSEDGPGIAAGFFSVQPEPALQSANCPRWIPSLSQVSPLPALIAALCTPEVLSAQSVVPDGSTATEITISSAGLVTVDIAPADTASISHNTYSAFSVPSAGVDLNNTSAQGSTIVNEVTSTRASHLNGPLTVIGPKADVILANPNGITVNGGRFQNTGNVALTTGALSRNGSDQVTAQVTTGGIEIGPGGLSGAMEELALIARSLRIDGPLRYDLPDAGSHINVITGEAMVSFDRARSGFGQDGTGQLPWALVTGRGAGSTSAVTVDITGNGSVSAGRISVKVTDQGAGVRFAGR